MVMDTRGRGTGLCRALLIHITVEPPITDSLRYGLPLYNRQTKCPLIDLAIEIISERWTTSYLWTMDRKRTLKGQIAVQNSLQEWTEIGWKT